MCVESVSVCCFILFDMSISNKIKQQTDQVFLAMNHKNIFLIFNNNLELGVFKI